MKIKKTEKRKFKERLEKMKEKIEEKSETHKAYITITDIKREEYIINMHKKLFLSIPTTILIRNKKGEVYTKNKNTKSIEEDIKEFERITKIPTTLLLE